MKEIFNPCLFTATNKTAHSCTWEVVAKISNKKMAIAICSQCGGITGGKIYSYPNRLNVK